VAVLQILKMHELIEPAGVPRQQPYATHLLASVGNLAFADRNRYLGDPDFVSIPVEGLLDSAYLRQRAALFRKDAASGVAQPGTPRGASALADDASLELPSTSHLSIVDADGNAVSMTVTVEDAFGSRQMVRGFLLNNELTDFSMTPEENGKPVANRVQGSKRPRSSMAPTVVFDRSGALHLVIGSPGGSAIINFVAQSVIAILDWGLDAQAALDLPHVGGRNGPVDLEKGTDAEGYKQALEALGHATRVSDMTSGLSAIQIIRGRIEAGVDPRKEGVALGD
jgi:gamma-glutamyltranspeptidase/glutathione hydrolase